MISRRPVLVVPCKAMPTPNDAGSHSPLGALSKHPLRTRTMPLVCRAPVGGNGMVSPEARAKIAEMFAKKRAEQVQFPDGKPIELRRREWEAEALLDQLPK